MSEMLIASTEDQHKFCAFFASVLWFSVFLEIFPTHLTMYWFQCLFHMDNHIEHVGAMHHASHITQNKIIEILSFYFISLLWKKKISTVIRYKYIFSFLFQNCFLIRLLTPGSAQTIKINFHFHEFSYRKFKLKRNLRKNTKKIWPHHK